MRKFGVLNDDNLWMFKLSFLNKKISILYNDKLEMQKELQ